MNNRIRYVQNDEELEWFLGPGWIKIGAIVEPHEKYYITQWLEKHTKHTVIIYNGATRPIQGDMNWEPKLLGDSKRFLIHFENRNEALHFKMSYVKQHD